MSFSTKVYLLAIVKAQGMRLCWWPIKVRRKLSRRVISPSSENSQLYKRKVSLCHAIRQPSVTRWKSRNIRTTRPTMIDQFCLVKITHSNRCNKAVMKCSQSQPSPYASKLARTIHFPSNRHNSIRQPLVSICCRSLIHVTSNSQRKVK